ncbi:MAG: FecR family protein [Chitinophagaceae bacterium]
MSDIQLDFIKELWQRYLKGEGTASEYRLLSTTLQLYPEVIDALIETEQILSVQDERNLDDSLGALKAQEILENIKRSTQSSKKPNVFYLQRRWLWGAASIVALFFLGLYFWEMKVEHPQATMNTSTEILPGKNGAILTLDDGSKVLLDSIHDGVIGLQGGGIAKVVNGVLEYESSGDEVVYNTISTPNGRQFHLILNDGTNVWLNSASSIRYPTVFAGDERLVEVKGEAYFEVVSNAEKPFRLKVMDKAEVEVLGTHFSLTAYENEEVITTTLLEGAVQVRLGPKYMSTVPAKSMVSLKPGQQALIRSNKQNSGIETIDRANIEKALAWKNGLFYFTNIDFAAAMRQIERWYDIEVIYMNGVPSNIELNGKLTKDVTLNGLLKGLKEIGVNGRLEGRKLLLN